MSVCVAHARRWRQEAGYILIYTIAWFVSPLLLFWAYPQVQKNRKYVWLENSPRKRARTDWEWALQQARTNTLISILRNQLTICRETDHQIIKYSDVRLLRTVMDHHNQFVISKVHYNQSVNKSMCNIDSLLKLLVLICYRLKFGTNGFVIKRTLLFLI